MSAQRSIPILDEEALRELLDELLVARLEDLGRSLVDALSPTQAERSPEALEPLLTVADMARLLQVDPKSIYRWRKEGRLPPCAEVGGRLRWDSSRVRTWLQERSADDQGRED